MFFKDVYISDASEKYGFNNLGVFANEFIRKGEILFKCDLEICDYLNKSNQGYTKDEVEEIIKTNPDSREFLLKYSCMIEEDLFDLPKNYTEQALRCKCMLLNHCCDPNCSFFPDETYFFKAIKDIQPHEEITWDYQIAENEESFNFGMECKCGSIKCRGILKFDLYRDLNWQERMYDYSSKYIKRKIDELKTKWYSSSCFVKRFYKNKMNKDKVEFGLVTLEKIGKNELVAKYRDIESLHHKNHYIRHSEDPTCTFSGLNVITIKEMDPSTEITLNFNLTNNW